MRHQCLGERVLGPGNTQVVLVTVIWQHVCFTLTIVADRVFVGVSECGRGHCVISIVDALVFGQGFLGISVSGWPVVI